MTDGAPARLAPEIAPSGPLEWNETMTTPHLLFAPEIQLPQKAIDADVRGQAVFKCVLTAQGAVTGCNVIKSLPGVDGAVMRALTGRKYAPVLYQGRPVAVLYTFKIRIDPD